MIGGNFQRSGMGGAPAPLPQGGIQGRAQANVPYQGMYNGNPMGANNTPQAPAFAANAAWQQQQQYGRYVPPTMQQSGYSGWNSNTWNQNQGPYNYNIPGSYGSPLGGGQFAPMPGMFQGYVPQQGGGSFYGPQQPMYDGMGPVAPQMQPGKDGTPLRVGPNTQMIQDMEAAMRAPTFQPQPWQRPNREFVSRDAALTGGTRPLDFLRQYGNEGEYAQAIRDRDDAFLNQQRINYNRAYRR